MPEIVPAAGHDLVALDRSVQAYHIISRRPSTWKAYAISWRRFTDFCAPKDVWKAEPRDVARWCAKLADQGVKPTTIRTHLSGLHFHYELLGKGHAHGRTGAAIRRSPARSKLVTDTIKGIRRRHARPPDRKRPLLLDSLEKMIDVQPDTRIGIRNRAILALGWAACRRVNEIVGLDIVPEPESSGWIELEEDGLVVVLVRSKANQDYRVVERYGVPARLTAPRYCPVQLLRAWLEVSGQTSGPLFQALWKGGAPRNRRVESDVIRGMIKTAAAAIGLNATDVSSHSLRAGCITWLWLEGVHPDRIREQSGHRDLRTLMDYIRPLRSPKNSPLVETRWVR